jgi:uncharacterized membrane protein
MSDTAARRTHLDVLRGVAVLVMIEAHVIDSWTRASDRASHGFRESMILGGFGAPLFLFLAGVAVSMSAGSKARRWSDPAAAARAVRNRGFQIFGLAFLFRFQSFVLSHAPAWTLLKVDVLNIMGPSIAGAAVLWRAGRTLRGRLAVFTIVSALIVWSTPAVRYYVSIAPLPDWIEGYFRPVPGLTNFTFFPWSAFVTAGGVVGLILDAARTAEADRRVNLAFGMAGAALAAAAYQASFLPPLDARSSFWTTSLSFFLLRLGIMTAAIGLAYLWERRPSAGRRWSPLQLLGRTSLFVYWIHVELVYGLVSLPLHGAFSLQGAWLALAPFCGLMLAAAVAKDYLARKYFGQRHLPGKLNRQVQALMF